MVKPSGCKNIETTKFKIVAKTPLLCSHKNRKIGTSFTLLNSLFALLSYSMIYIVTNKAQSFVLMEKVGACCALMREMNFTVKYTCNYGKVRNVLKGIK